jgi:murein DD-endopeptidase MepM/ murein hydrolase activator NlpD
MEVRGGPRRALLAPLLLACLLGASLPAAAGPEERLDRVDEQQQRIESRLERVRAIGDRLAGRIDALDAERVRVEAIVAGLTRRIGALDAEIAATERRLAQAQQHLALLTERLEAIGERLEARRDVFHARAVDAYKAGPAAPMDALLSAGSISDLLDRAAYFESALDADSALLDEIELLEDEAATRRGQVERKRNEIAADKAALESRRAALDRARDDRAEALAARRSAIARKRALLAQVEGREDRLRSAHRQLEQESDRIAALLAAASYAPGALAAGGELAWPAPGPVTSGFGWRVHPLFGDRRMHTGIDISAPYGAPVWAAGDGVVAYVGSLSGYGQVVIVDHGGGLASTYNHLSTTLVGSGEGVRRGEHIAAVGCSGYCTGPHLHFEVRVNGTPVDPMPYLR